METSVKNYLWQLYDEQGREIPGVGSPKQEVVIKGLLHATAHIWLWRQGKRHVEVLVQHRARIKVNWPGLLDKSAGGHIRLNETPLEAATRKADDELGIVLAPEELVFVGIVRWHGPIGDMGLVENELQWVYVAEARQPLELKPGEEVEATRWLPLTALQRGLRKDRGHFVPYDPCYFSLTLTALDRIAIHSAPHI